MDEHPASWGPFIRDVEPRLLRARIDFGGLRIAKATSFLPACAPIWSANMPASIWSKTNRARSRRSGIWPMCRLPRWKSNVGIHPVRAV